MLSPLIRRVCLSACLKNELLVCGTIKPRAQHVCTSAVSHSRDNSLYNYTRGSNEKGMGKVVTLKAEKVKAFRVMNGKHGAEEEDSAEKVKQKEAEEQEVWDDMPPFVRMGEDTTLLRTLMLQVKSSKVREKTNKILLEGKRLLQDALGAGAKPLAIFFSRPVDLKDINIPDGTPVYKVMYKNLQLWSEVVTSQGVLGIFEMPDVESYKAPSRDVAPITIVCDNIRDPGNMGTILRTACAIGTSQLLLTKGCVDIWEPKVLRAAAGAHFRMKILKGLTWGEVQGLVDQNQLVCVADSDRVHQKTKSAFARGAQSGLPLVRYHSSYLNAGLTHVTLIIGGETEGVSEEAWNFARARPHARRVYVPLYNHVESLNSATALGIIAYEMRRQLMGERGEGGVISSSAPEQFQSVGLYTE